MGTLNFLVNLLGNGDNSISASDAFSVATFNEVVTDEMLMKRFFETTDQLIRNKSQNNYFSLVMDLNDTMYKFKNELMQYYQEKNFYVAILESTQEYLTDLPGKYLFLSWNK